MASPVTKLNVIYPAHAKALYLMRCFRYYNVFLSHDTCLPLGVTERGMEYEFRIAGQNHIGFGQESIKYLLTPEGPPSGPPTNISYHFQTPDVVCVTWDIPLREHRNGQITHYDIEFHKKVDHTSVTDRNTTQTKVKESLSKVNSCDCY